MVFSLLPIKKGYWYYKPHNTFITYKSILKLIFRNNIKYSLIVV